jgi:hypothetical protein
VSANVDYTTGAVARLDRVHGIPAPLTERDVQDPTVLVRVLVGLLRDVARLLGLWRPRRVDFTNIVSAGTAMAPERVRLVHKLNGDVRWWPVDVLGPGSATVPMIIRDETTVDDRNTLTLDIYYAATFAIRVEEAG